MNLFLKRQFSRGGCMFKGTLYPFQQEASEAMTDRGQMLLALVMGAGKTITTLAALETLKDQGEIKKTLIVVPSSLKYQWEREIKKFTDSSCMVVDGTISTRKKQWRASLSSTYVIINSESLKNDLADF